MKKGVKNLIRAVGFFTVLVFSVVSFSYILAPKDNTKEAGIVNPSAHGFYSEPKNTIDVAVIGNSDAYSGFSPMELWKNYGYTSYVSGVCYAERYFKIPQAEGGNFRNRWLFYKIKGGGKRRENYKHLARLLLFGFSVP